MTAFEDRLWDRLVSEHDADHLTLDPGTPPAARPVRPLVLSGGLTTVAVVIAAVVVGLTAASTAPPAYALTDNPDGSVTVTIHDLETAIPELNARFRALGIDETIVPVEADCPSSGGQTGLFHDPMFADPEATPEESFTLSPGRKHLDPGFTGVMAAEQLPDGEVAIAVEAVKPPVPTCFPTTAYTVVNNGTTTDGIPSSQVVPVNPTTTAPGAGG